ncbi:MAG: protein phosphatase 2C domain-containing protein [Paraperlucidibaca sp.]
MSLRWRQWAVTDIGTRRSQNEDAIVLRDDVQLWAVIDGLGGQDTGTVASAALAHALANLRLESQLADACDQLDDVLLAVHEQIYAFSQIQEPPRLVGATVGVLRASATWSLFVWVGDVRLYRLRDGQLTLLSQDHLDDQGDLTRLIGADEPLPDALVLRAQAGDRYLLCSDGLHAQLLEKRLQHWLGRDPVVALRELVAEALAAGGRDNVSLVLLEVSDGDN